MPQHSPEVLSGQAAGLHYVYVLSAGRTPVADIAREDWWAPVDQSIAFFGPGAGAHERGLLYVAVERLNLDFEVVG